MANTAERVFNLIKDTVEEQGVTLWDVRFLKEGATWYLRVFIDKPEGISIDDCTNVSHAIDPIIDEADPIDISYYLEVCSPGIERELTRPEHYNAVLGEEIKIKLYKGVDGCKEFIGKLIKADDDITLEIDGEEVSFQATAISKAQLISQ